MVKTIEVVVHCSALEEEFYAGLLKCHLETFALYPPQECQVQVTLCWYPSDKHTKVVLDAFCNRFPAVDLRTIELTPERLGRRAIGRNLAARTNRADIVWFTDCDYKIKGHALDYLAQYEWDESVSLIYPNHTYTEQGAWTAGEFKKTKNHRAIGGIQIVPGWIARENGYCANHNQHQKPTDGRFYSCKCDRSFRKEMKRYGSQLGVDIPGVWRLTHPKRKYKYDDAEMAEREAKNLASYGGGKKA